MQAVGSGKGRRAVSVLRVLKPGVSGFRFAGHGADKLVVREGRRGLFKYREGRGGNKAALAVVHMSGAGLQRGAVMRVTGEKQGENKDGCEGKQSHAGLVTWWLDQS